ncbi:MAG: hypothetical protein ABI604_00895 [Nitrospirota bacterium]
MITKGDPLPRAYVLLSSLSIETALKGLLVTRNPALVSEGALPKSLGNHKLSSLASRLDGLNLDNNERALLRTLEQAMVYWARYPIPRSWNHSVESFDQHFIDEYRSVFNKFQQRLCRLIYDETRNGWAADNGVSEEFFIESYERRVPEQ